MASLRYTGTKNVGELWKERQLVAALIPHLKWRWHGIGLLQAYICEGDRELRVHIWSPALMLSGIQESGNAHNHRFMLTSTVLVGELGHTEWHLSHDAQHGDHDLWDFPHARLQTEETRSFMRQLHLRCNVTKVPEIITAGQRYCFERGAYHSSEPLTDVVVTLVEKTDQVETNARVVAPLGTPPIPAFSGEDLEQRNPEELLAKARDALLGLSHA